MCEERGVYATSLDETQQGKPHESLGAIECREMADAEGVERVCCEIRMAGKDKLLIGCIYRSPNSNAINDARIYYTLKKANNLRFSHVLIFGDLNHHCLNWRDNTSPNDETTQPPSS